MDFFILNIRVVKVGTLHACILNNVHQQALRMYKQKRKLKQKCTCMFLDHLI